MMRSIKHLQPGRGVSICGVITEIDQAPMTVSVGTDSRLAHIFHFTLTDNDSSIQITAWDRVPDFANFKLGEKVHISNVTVKQVTGFFAEYGHYAGNFGRGSQVGRVPADIDTSTWQNSSIRIPSQVTTPSHTFSRPDSGSDTQEQNARPPKRSRDTSISRASTTPTCEHCDAPSEPFCENTGNAHDARCNLCKKLLTKTKYCSKTGLAHEPHL